MSKLLENLLDLLDLLEIVTPLIPGLLPNHLVDKQEKEVASTSSYEFTGCPEVQYPIRASEIPGTWFL